MGSGSGCYRRDRKRQGPDPPQAPFCRRSGAGGRARRPAERCGEYCSLPRSAISRAAQDPATGRGSNPMTPSCPTPAHGAPQAGSALPRRCPPGPARSSESAPRLCPRLERARRAAVLRQPSEQLPHRRHVFKTGQFGLRASDLLVAALQEQHCQHHHRITASAPARTSFCQIFMLRIIFQPPPTPYLSPPPTRAAPRPSPAAGGPRAERSVPDDPPAQGSARPLSHPNPRRPRG